VHQSYGFKFGLAGAKLVTRLLSGSLSTARPTRLDLLDMLDLLVVVFNFFHLSCGMSYTVHTRGHSAPAILALLALLALLVVVF